MDSNLNILFIHGFNSSPRSFKAEATAQYLQENHPDIQFICPQLVSNPFIAIEQLEAIINAAPQSRWCLVGSSLGGFFATFLSEKYQCPAVLINPAVRPFELAGEIAGKQYNPYTEEHYEVTEQQVCSLKSLECKSININHFFVMVQTGDEVLDYQKAVAKYHGCQMRIEQGGDHSYINFSATLPLITEFFNLS